LVLPIFYTPKRFVAYSKHHKALCGLFKTPQSALWPTYSKHHKALCGLPIQNTTKRFADYLFKTPQSALWPTIQNTTKHFVVVIIIIAIFR